MFLLLLHLLLVGQHEHLHDTSAEMASERDQKE